VATEQPLRVPVGEDASRWVTVGAERTLLAVARTVTSTVRVLEALELLRGDVRVQVVFAVNESSPFVAGVPSRPSFVTTSWSPGRWATSVTGRKRAAARLSAVFCSSPGDVSFWHAGAVPRTPSTRQSGWRQRADQQRADVQEASDRVEAQGDVVRQVASDAANRGLDCGAREVACSMSSSGAG